MPRQIGNHVKSALGLAAATLAEGATNGTAIDCRGYDEVVAVLVTGAVAGTAPTLDVKLQESNSAGGTFADITGATIAQVTAASKFGHVSARINIAKPWIRAVATVAGTGTPTVVGGVNLLLAEPPLQPA